MFQPNAIVTRKPRCGITLGRRMKELHHRRRAAIESYSSRRGDMAHKKGLHMSPPFTHNRNSTAPMDDGGCMPPGDHIASTMLSTSYEVGRRHHRACRQCRSGFICSAPFTLSQAGSEGSPKKTHPWICEWDIGAPHRNPFSSNRPLKAYHWP